MKLTTLAAGLAAATALAAMPVPGSPSATTWELVVPSDGAASPADADPDAEHTHEVQMVTSFDGVDIRIDVLRPAGADADAQVPVVLRSHGWGGRGNTSVDAQRDWLDNGFGVVSVTARGGGQSGGLNFVHDPEVEGRDYIAIIDEVATWDWILHDTDADGNVIADDPVMGGLGGSYGGGFQHIAAFADLELNGRQRFNALAPGVTWHDLTHSLAPYGAMRTIFVTGLYAFGNLAYTLHPRVHEMYAAGMGTGTFLPMDAEEFTDHGPAGFVDDGLRLDIPVLYTQGLSDTLFNGNEAIDNYNFALTDEARAESYVLMHNGGHLMGTSDPIPGAMGAKNNPCGPTVWTMEFYRHHLLGEDNELADPGIYHSTIGGRCVPANTTSDMTVDVLDADLPFVAGGAPQLELFELAGEGTTVAGVPTIQLESTTVHPDARIFAALATEVDGELKVIHNQWMPVVPELGVNRVTTAELGAVAADIEPGAKLYLALSSTHQQFVAHFSRTPGPMVLHDVKVTMPTQ